MRAAPRLCATVLCLACTWSAQAGSVAVELDALRREMAALERDISQYRITLEQLAPDAADGAAVSNPAIAKLQEEYDRLNEERARLRQQEMALLQSDDTDDKEAALERAEDLTPESKPIRHHTTYYTAQEEERSVERLLVLLDRHNRDEQKSMEPEPDPALAALEAAVERDAKALSRIPFSADKVRLSGAEGNIALAQISERLANPDVPASRHDFALICNLQTRLDGQLTSTSTRSLQPVGKNHYLARITLPPGETSFTVRDHKWHVRLPRDIGNTEFLVTLYAPASIPPELHVIPLDEIVAQKTIAFPSWFPPELGLTPDAG